ncbi:hypothetical protein J6590_107296, partial [Homalodisca vitripennis]
MNNKRAPAPGARVPPPVQNDQTLPPVPPRLIDLSVANLVEVFRGDGSEPSVKDFFRLFENAAGTGRWSKEDMVRVLQLKVKCPAATFISTFIEHAGHEVVYEDIKKAVIDRFTGKHTQQYHYSNLSNALQQKGESVEAFADRVRRLGVLTISHRIDPIEQQSPEYMFSPH